MTKIPEYSLNQPLGYQGFNNVTKLGPESTWPTSPAYTGQLAIKIPEGILLRSDGEDFIPVDVGGMIYLNKTRGAF